jgi:ribosomal protein L11 methyltransferase
MKHFVFRLKEGATIEDALIELEPLLSDIYEMDDPETGIVQIGGYSDAELTETLSYVILEQVFNVEEIDWQKQWSEYAPNFYQGLAHVDLSEYGAESVKLKPGGGFGDFSHPTTRLTLALMSAYVKGKTVIDIGCGSGILSIAAVLLGATHAFGIDIEEQALEHSWENAKLNQIEAKVDFANQFNPAWKIEEPCVIVMNMIETEQQSAWNSALDLHKKRAYIVTSGILTAQQEHYLELTKSWGWKLKEKKEEGDWISFAFSQN